MAISSSTFTFCYYFCIETFESNNKLHKYLWNKCKYCIYKLSENLSSSSSNMFFGDFVKDILPKSTIKKTSNILFKFISKKALTLSSTSILFIKTSIDLNITLGTKYSFQRFQYATATYVLTKSSIINLKCLDTGCIISMYNIETFIR